MARQRRNLVDSEDGPKRGGIDESGWGEYLKKAKIEKGPSEVTTREVVYCRCDTCNKYIPKGTVICPFCQADQKGGYN
jgi:hypothetical protein